MTVVMNALSFRTRPTPVSRRPVAGRLGELVRFALVGGGASVLQLATYAFLADGVGSQAANILAWLVSTLVATEAHRRYSFGGARSGTESDHMIGIASSAVGLALGAAALSGLDNPTGAAGVLALIAVNGLVGLGRFGFLRWWLVSRRAAGQEPGRRSHATPSRSPSMSTE